MAQASSPSQNIALMNDKIGQETNTSAQWSLFLSEFGDLKTKKITVACSLQREDVIIMDLLKKAQIPFDVYCLDTGRLHPETYQMMDRVKNYFQVPFRIYTPETNQLQDLISQKGLYSFKESVENRKECCEIRKVNPNKRALAGYDVYFTGMRREQSLARANTAFVQEDAGSALIKVAPLAYWSKAEVEAYIKDSQLPDHPLYQHGFTSIGCEPCTRAVAATETDDRAGRWWWESDDHKECGLHWAQK